MADSVKLELPVVLQQENEELRRQLEEARETLEAIRSGAVDALVVEEPTGHRIYTLEGAERPYRLFVEEMQQGAATLHTDGTIAWCNRQLGQLLKTPQEKLVGAPLRDFVSAESRTVYDNLLWQGQSRSGRGEAQMLRSDNAPVPVFLTFNALPKDCGSAIGVLVTDLTSQRHHEQLSAAHFALRKSQQQLALVTETAPVFIAHCDADARYKFVNERYAARFGLKPADCVGKRISEVVGEAAFASLRPYVDMVLSGQPVGFEVEFPHAVIGKRFMHVSYAPEVDAEGRIVGFVAAISDISERKEAERALGESRMQSERQRRIYQAILTNTPDFAYVFDLQHRFIYANDVLLKTWGRTWEEAMGKNCLELGYEVWHAAMHDREIEQVVATRQSIRGEVPFHGTNGRRIYDYIFVPVFGANGEVEAVAGTTRDITERKQSEEVHARLAAIVDSSDDAIISKTLDGIVTSWNAAAEHLLGYRADEIIGQPIFTLIPPDRRDEEVEILQRLRREERAQHFETVRMRKDGQLIEVSLSISPIRDTTGKVIGASKILHDITERKKVEDQLRAAQNQLQRHARELESRVAERTADLQSTNEQLEAFVYSIAHDLRAPLRSMQGFSTLLVEEVGAGLSATGREFANRISRSAQFLDALLQDLLAFSRVAKDRSELAPVKLGPVVASVISRLEKEIQEKDARVEFLGDWPTVLAHEPTLGQVLFNLVSNSLKFVAPSLRPVIRLRAEEVSAAEPCVPSSLKWVRVWVEDNGIGIAPHHQEQIFRLFIRLHGEKYPGTGLGLAIVQKGIERMGGRVWLESITGHGSRFWFELRKA